MVLYSTASESPSDTNSTANDCKLDRDGKLRYLRKKSIYSDLIDYRTLSPGKIIPFAHGSGSGRKMANVRLPTCWVSPGMARYVIWDTIDSLSNCKVPKSTKHPHHIRKSITMKIASPPPCLACPFKASSLRSFEICREFPNLKKAVRPLACRIASQDVTAGIITAKW